MSFHMPDKKAAPRSLVCTLPAGERHNISAFFFLLVLLVLVLDMTIKRAFICCDVLAGDAAMKAGSRAVSRRAMPRKVAIADAPEAAGRLRTNKYNRILAVHDCVSLIVAASPRDK